MTFLIRPAHRNDLPDIARIQSASPEASFWAPPAYLDYDCRVAVVDGTVAGFLAARDVGPGETEILNVAVDPTFRRRGVASELVRAALSAHPGTVYLEVRVSNQAAGSLYRKLGFREAGIRPKYYSDPVEDGIVMARQSC